MGICVWAFSTFARVRMEVSGRGQGQGQGVRGGGWRADSVHS